MFYIENEEKIVLFDENKEKLTNTLSFMPQYKDLEIKETDRPIVDFQFADTDDYETEQIQKERERLDGLSMTRGDVFEALILAKGLGKAQIRKMIENEDLNEVTKLLYLNRFDEALEFYRGYPIFDLLGKKLNITPTMLDNFFETKDYKYLTQVTLMVNVIPETATVTLNGQEAKELTMPYNSTVEAVVTCEGYNEYFDTFTLTENKIVDVELDAKPVETDTDIDTNIESEVDNAGTIE